MKNLTTIMYHYVRPIRGSKFSGIKGLEINDFRKQLDYLSENYKFIDPLEFIELLKLKKTFSPKTCLLTFDDGYKDHYKFFFPELKKRNIKALFFIPSGPIKNKLVLDVNKIHLILSETKNEKSLFEYLIFYLESKGISKTSIFDFKSRFFHKGDYDSKYVIFIKNLLQHALPENIRKEVLEHLYKKITININDNFYLNLKEIKKMIKYGMFIGNHGHSHLWLNKIPLKEKIDKIQKGIDFLETIGHETKNWVMSYLYGEYDLDTIKIIKNLGCICAFKADTSKNYKVKNRLFELPRFDTNDFLF